MIDITAFDSRKLTLETDDVTGSNTGGVFLGLFVVFWVFFRFVGMYLNSSPDIKSLMILNNILN